MNDLHELNNLWKELPTMERLNVVSDNYACRNVTDALHEVHEHGVQEGRQQERERQEMEHCREHMGDGHRNEGRSWFAKGAEHLMCFMSDKIKDVLYKDAIKINEQEAVADVKSLIKFRNDYAV